MLQWLETVVRRSDFGLNSDGRRRFEGSIVLGSPPLRYLAWLTAGVGLTVLFTAGCQDPTPPPVAAGRAATLIVIREDRWAFSEGDWDVYINGTEYGSVGNGETERFSFEPLPEGSTISVRPMGANSWWGFVSEPMRFQAEQGQTYSVSCRLRVWRNRILLAGPELGEIDPEEMRRKGQENDKARVERAKKAAAGKKGRPLPTSGGLSGFLAHGLWHLYRPFPPLGGWDWLLLFVMVSVLGRLLYLPFLWEAVKVDAKAPKKREGLRQSNFAALWNLSWTWFWVWFFQTTAGKTFLEDRVWLGAQSVADANGRLLLTSFLIACVATGIACGLFADDIDRKGAALAGIHMEAGVLLVLLLFYWYWSVASLTLFLSGIAASLITELAHRLFVSMRQRVERSPA